MSKRIAILGSTGSIGQSTLDVVRHLSPLVSATALSAHSQVQKLIEQTRQFKPGAVAVTDDKVSDRDIQKLKETGAEVLVGASAMETIVQRDDVDMVVAAVVGAAGLPAVLKAVQAGKSIALANKESLVVAGALLIPEARRRNVPIIPVDSEHSAVFQAMCCGKLPEVRRVILTASGGPFRNTPIEQMKTATVQDALAHPTWRMGSKITIDSATMFNKALELIEACWLFDLKPEQVEIVIHPESIVHSMVEFVDGSVIAQLSPPDMRTPIQYALTYPNRREGISRRLDLSKHLTLHFHPPDENRFPAIQLAYQTARAGGTAGAILNAANEVAVAAFLDGKVSFGEISEIVSDTISNLDVQPVTGMDDLFEADRAARQRCLAMVLG